MSKRSTTKAQDDERSEAPITRADIASGRLVPRQRKPDGSGATRTTKPARGKSSRD